MSKNRNDSPGKILLIDHFKAKGKTLKKNLEKVGFEVSLATDGAAGLKLATEWECECLLVRLSMPKMDGIEVCRQFRGMSHLSSAPVVFIVPNKLDEKRTAAGLKAGGNDFVSRTTSPSILRSRLASAVAQARSAREVERLQTTDALTGLLSRRVVLEELERQVKGLLSMRTPQVTCLLMNLDGFKAVNNEAGFAVGDKILKGTAKVLNRTVRDGDLIARFSGSEFAVLLGEASLDIAKKRGEAVRAAVEKAKFPAEITASVGVATISHEWLEDQEGPGAAKVVQALLQRADHALQRAKRGQGNKVMAYRP
jgi:diguanylate cyclase (GGDEF)-like protein